MRFIHIADVHLGAQPDAGEKFSGNRPRELWDTLEHVIRICGEERADLLLVAGDLFHRQPLLRELKEVNALFSELGHTKVVLIAGNHDPVRRDSYYRGFRWAENVIPLLGEKMEYVEFPELETAVYGLSYHAREIREPLYDCARAQGIQRYELLLAHGGDEKHIPINVEKLKRTGFDYVALGHIHKPHSLVKDRVVYSGALEPIDRNDTGPHGFVRGEVTEQGIRIRWSACACREYFHRDIRVDEGDTVRSIRRKMENEIREYGDENIYKFVLKGFRDRELMIEPGHWGMYGNVIEVIDETRPALDLERLRRENEDSLIGRYIGQFDGCREGSVEYQALCEGVSALLDHKGRQI